MNYVRHLNAFVKHAHLHPEWDCFHLSMYYVLFHVWNYKKFKPLFKVSREVLMRASRVKSVKKYYQCLKGLHRAGMIVYYPSCSMKQLATIGMVELFEPKSNVPALFGKPDEVVYIAPVGSTNTTDEVAYIPPVGSTNTTDEVAYIPPIGSINTTDKVVQIPHSLKGKTIKDLKSVCVNGHPPTGNNHFSFFSSPATACMPPGSVQEVKDYFLQQGYPLLEATNFFDYYAITGWKTRSGAAVVNWQSAARRWMLTGASQQRIAINTLKHGADQHLHTTRDKDYSKPL
ncbi:hypothetical protein [Chitinophaga defluvii]|uniref:Uncharacterized protein n=1 Tax=Chitinophaga defluvii TaxID=3163343 RepID=A0ABV2TAU3_9BACT